MKDTDTQPPTLPELAMSVLREHPEVRLRHPLVAVCFPAERVGDTISTGGGDLLVMVHPDGKVDTVACHARVEAVDSLVPGEGKVAIVYARSAHGEYRVNAIGATNPELPQAHAATGSPSTEEVMLMVARVRARHLAIHAALYQRERWARDTALALPAQAGALASMSTAGRMKSTRVAALSGRGMKVDTVKEIEGRAIRERVTVELVIPKSRAKLVKLKASEPVFPQFKDRPRRELAALVIEEMAQRLARPRVMQGVLAGIAVAYEAGSVRLDDDGELPDKFRTEVMRVMGMPSSSASAAQRALAKQAMVLVRHAEFEVKAARGKGSTYLPLLVVQEFIDAPGTGERRAARLAVNDELMGSMAEGKKLRIPEALFQIGDEDRDGVRTLAGLQLAYRLAMGTEGYEKLELFLRRAGLWEWCMREVRNHGMPHVMRELRQELDALRSLPWRDHSPADIAGGTVIEGEVIDKAIVVYRDTPSWARSSP